MSSCWQQGTGLRQGLPMSRSVLIGADSLQVSGPVQSLLITQVTCTF